MMEEIICKMQTQSQSLSLNARNCSFRVESFKLLSYNCWALGASLKVREMSLCQVQSWVFLENLHFLFLDSVSFSSTPKSSIPLLREYL